MKFFNNFFSKSKNDSFFEKQNKVKDVTITFYGHSCLGIEIEGKYLLLDPFITPNPLANHINIDDIKVDYLLITHAHKDHTFDVESILERTNVPIISNFEVVEHYISKGFKGHPMDFGGYWNFDFGHLRYVSAIHSSAFPCGKYGGNPGGFIIKTKKGTTLYISGDTALTLDMKLIPMRYKLDLAILPIGNNFTMDVEDAIVASDFIECNNVMGVHYDTFDYIKINKQEAMNRFSAAGKELKLLGIGESLIL